MGNHCRGCGAEIQWIIAPSGKKVPVEVTKSMIWVKIKERETVHCPHPVYHWKLISGYESHFAKCPNAADFKKGR